MKKYKALEKKVEELQNRVNTLGFLINHKIEDIALENRPKLEGADLWIQKRIMYLRADEILAVNDIVEVNKDEEKDYQIRINKVDGVEYVELWQRGNLNSVQRINRLTGTLSYVNWVLYVTAYHKELLKNKSEV